MFAQNLVGAQVEMRSLEVGCCTLACLGLGALLCSKLRVQGLRAWRTRLTNGCRRLLARLTWPRGSAWAFPAPAVGTAGQHCWPGRSCAAAPAGADWLTGCAGAACVISALTLLRGCPDALPCRAGAGRRQAAAGARQDGRAALRHDHRGDRLVHLPLCDRPAQRGEEPLVGCLPGCQDAGTWLPSQARCPARCSCGLQSSQPCCQLAPCPGL